MTDMLIEAVFMAFVVGGIVGAVIAVSLKSSTVWGRQYDTDKLAEPQPLRIDSERRRYRR